MRAKNQRALASHRGRHARQPAGGDRSFSRHSESLGSPRRDDALVLPLRLDQRILLSSSMRIWHFPAWFFRFVNSVERTRLLPVLHTAVALSIPNGPRENLLAQKCRENPAPSRCPSSNSSGKRAENPDAIRTACYLATFCYRKSISIRKYLSGPMRRPRHFRRRGGIQLRRRRRDGAGMATMLRLARAVCLPG